MTIFQASDGVEKAIRLAVREALSEFVSNSFTPEIRESVRVKVSRAIEETLEKFGVHYTPDDFLVVNQPDGGFDITWYPGHGGYQ